MLSYSEMIFLERNHPIFITWESTRKHGTSRGKYRFWKATHVVGVMRNSAFWLCGKIVINTFGTIFEIRSLVLCFVRLLDCWIDWSAVRFTNQLADRSRQQVNVFVCCFDVAHSSIVLFSFPSFLSAIPLLDCWFCRPFISLAGIYRSFKTTGKCISVFRMVFDCFFGWS